MNNTEKMSLEISPQRGEGGEEGRGERERDVRNLRKTEAQNAFTGQKRAYLADAS